MGSYACPSNVCSKEEGNYYYIVTFNDVTFEVEGEVVTLTNVVITVSKPTANPDYGKDRAQLELTLKFGE